MNELRQLAKLVSPNNIKHPRIIQGKQTTKVEKLYHKLRRDEPASADDFFPPSSYQAITFNKLKKELEERLINSLLLRKPDANESDIKKASSLCFKILTAINELRTTGLQKTAAKLAEKYIKVTLKYEFSILTYQFAEFLEYYHGNLSGNLSKFQQYASLAQTAFQDLEAEKKAQKAMLLVTAYHSNKKNFSTTIVQQAERHLQELYAVAPKVQSTRFHMLTFNLAILIQEMKTDYQGIIKVCDQAFEFFATKPHFPDSRKINFQIRKLPALILLKRFKEAETEIQKALTYAQPKSYNFAVLHIYRCFLGFHANALPTIRTSLNELTTTPHKKLSEQILILKAYYKFLSHDPQLNIQAFLRNMPIFSKDKRGNNINILIAQIILLIQSKDFLTAESRIESLQSYAQRNLHKEDFRSNTFIKLLNTILQGSFHKKRVAPRAKKYLQKLELFPLEEAHQNFELEIIRYEILWEKVFELLD